MSALKSRREALGLSQLALAVKAGVALNTVSLAERSGRLTKATAEKLAVVLGCAAEDVDKVVISATGPAPEDAAKPGDVEEWDFGPCADPCAHCVRESSVSETLKRIDAAVQFGYRLAHRLMENDESYDEGERIGFVLQRISEALKGEVAP